MSETTVGQSSAPRASDAVTPSVFTAQPSQPPPVDERSLLAWLRKNFFGSIGSSITTAFFVLLILWTVPGFIDWAFINSVWMAVSHEDCRAASGACWAVVGEKHRPMLFGLYPYEEHWRMVIALVVYLTAVTVTLYQRFWDPRILIPVWVATFLVVGILLWGGVFGLRYVDTTQWGGLPLTMVLFTGTVVMGMPLAVLLALGRQSNLPLVKAVCVTFIECLRGVPLITILFVAVNVFPLFLPQGVELNKLLRIMVGMAIFFACYQAEVIRGGLQAIPKGQYEAANSLGLNYWHTTSRIILPQALRICLPGIVNHIIAALKNTSFVIIVGLFDILTATTAVMDDPLWRRFYIEAYLFVALVYFVFCFALSKYSQNLEAWLNAGRNR